MVIYVYSGDGDLPPQNFVRLYELGQYEFVVTFKGVMLISNFILKNRLGIHARLATYRWRETSRICVLFRHIVQRMLNALCRSWAARSRLLWMHKDVTRENVRLAERGWMCVVFLVGSV